jgi:cysteinyl-tRNA synthetase
LVDGKALVKIMPPAELIKARDEKRAALTGKAAEKEAAKAAARKQQLAKLEKGKIQPTEMFKPPNVPEGTYSDWDGKGIPILDGQGQELSKAKSKKLLKEWQEQSDKHDKWLAHLADQGADAKE